MKSLAATGIALVCAMALAQPAATSRFEVASIKPSAADRGPEGIYTGHGLLRAERVTLKRCILGAYGVGPHQISGGPDWLDSERFEIVAKSEKGTDGDTELMVMLRNLLADRFKLAIHRESKVMAAFVLEAGKNGPKLEKVGDGESSTNSSSTNTGIRIDARFTSMDVFARVLARQLEAPVVNRTGLEGVFNFGLQWVRENSIEGPSIYTAIQDQLGLRLRAERTPIEVIVIDHAERPSEN